MHRVQLKRIINSLDPVGNPRIEIIRRARVTGPRLGIFAASFNPPTIAHVELMRRAAETFSLDETLALAGRANADKSAYECSLEDRLAMLELSLKDETQTSIGLASHAFYVDKLDALGRVYAPETDLHFIIGFDTFVRVLDRDGKYTAKYHRRFKDREDALKYLLERSRLIVAARAGAGLDEIRALIDEEPALTRERVLYLDFPNELAELSATAARSRVRAGLPVNGLVPAAVEQYIQERELYKQSC